LAGVGSPGKPLSKKFGFRDERRERRGHSLSLVVQDCFSGFKAKGLKPRFAFALA
jgi:hypothetical protein